MEQSLSQPQIPKILRRALGGLVNNRHGSFQTAAYELCARGENAEYLVLYRNLLENGTSVPFVRLHSACIASDVFGADRCDCGWQLEAAMERIVREESGVIVYAVREEGRGAGLLIKTESCSIMDRTGCTTAQAFRELGAPIESRSFMAAAVILADLGVTSVRLMTNNPAKAEGLCRGGISVEELVPLILPARSPQMRSYLRSKGDEMGHLIPEIL